MVVQVGCRRVGAQGEGLLQAAHAEALSAGEGQGLAAGREAAFSGATGEIFVAQRGRQAVGIPRPAAGEARVEPGAVGLARERRRLVVARRKAAGRLVGEEARAWLRERVVVFVLSDHGVIGEGVVLWKRLVALWVVGGGWFVDNTGFSLLCTHGLIVLLRCVVVAVKVPAELANVTIRCWS